MLSCWCSIDLLMIFFFVSPFVLTRMNILIRTLQGSYLVLTYLFLHKIFFKLRPVWNVTLNPNFRISFLIFGPIFGTQGKVTLCFLLVLLLLLSLLLVPHVFFSKLLIIFCNIYIFCNYLLELSFYHVRFRKISQLGILFQSSNIFQNRFW